VGTLSYPANGGTIGTLGPTGTSGDLVFTSGSVSLDTLKALMVDASGLKVNVATYDVLGAGGSSLNAVLTEVNARDVTLIIDYGGKLGMPVERYSVSVTGDNVTHRTVDQVLRTIVRRDYQVGAITPVDGGVANPLGLSGIIAPVDGGTLIGTDLSNRQFWEVAHLTSNGVTQQLTVLKPGTPYDFSQLVLIPGDVLQLTYMEDLDGDNVGIRQEAAYGTSDLNTDTDGDNLSDYEEVYLDSTDPTRADPDQDGINDFHELWYGLDPFDATTNPGVPDQEARFLQVAQGDQLSLAVARDGTLWGWGDPTYLPAVSGCTGACWNTPVRLDPGTAHTWWRVAVTSRYAGSHGYALRDDNTLWAFGDNEYGYTAQGTTTVTNALVQVPLPTGAVWQDVAAGPEHTVALDSLGHLWSWGLNTSHQLGVTTTTTCTSNGGSVNACAKTPQALDQGHTYQSVAAGIAFTLAVRTDGTLWLVSGTAPTQVGTDSDWSRVVASNQLQSSNKFAFKNDGTLWAWGANTYGGLGLGDTSSRALPTQVGTRTDWYDVAVGWQSSLFVTTSGELFLSDATGALAPVAVPGSHPGVFVAAGGRSFSVVTDNLRAFAFGDDSAHQLGIGSTPAGTTPATAVPVGNYR
jgi:alpha-tubulin suppressor-like RCC1 family protein